MTNKEKRDLIKGLSILLLGPMAVGFIIALLFVHPLIAMIVAVPAFWFIVYYVISGKLVEPFYHD